MNVLASAKSLTRRVARPILDAQEWRAKGSLYTSVHGNTDPARHLAEAAAWLCRAQDFGSNRGVSYGTEFGKGFLESYPETTGYIIDTFLELAHHFRDEQYLRRALEMGEWESNIQMSSGAVMGGIYNSNPTPAVFNTGMVLLGWSALYEETHSDRFRRSGERAANWLLEMQEGDGNWIRGNSQFAENGITVYNVKAAWGLARMGQVLDSKEYMAAAVRNAEFALSKQRPNGWFADCCLTDARRPLLHTIAYTMQGLVGVGKIAGRMDFIDAAARTAHSLRTLLMPDGFLPGQIDERFQGASTWSCLTGNAQTSIIWSELERLLNAPQYGEAAAVANDYLMKRHDITSDDPAIRGGVPGSWPVSGEYGKYRILNWATKFFVDALLMRNSAEGLRFVV